METLRKGSVVKFGTTVLVLTIFSFTGHSALGSPIAYEVTHGAGGGFQFSLLHNASNANGMEPFYPVGNKTARIDGTLVGDITSTTLTFGPSVLMLTGLGPSPFQNEIWAMEITGGSFDLPTGGFSGDLLGTLDYIIRRPDTTVYDSGSFFFFDEDFLGPPTELTAAAFHLWGNNWNNATTDREAFVASGGIPLGIDIGGGGTTGPPVPEPSSFVLAGLAILAGTYQRSRRSRSGTF